MRHLKEFNTGERSIERVSELQAINFGQVFPSLNILIIRLRKPPHPVPLDGVGVISCRKKKMLHISFLQVYDFFASDLIGQNFLLITASQVKD